MRTNNRAAFEQFLERQGNESAALRTRQAVSIMAVTIPIVPFNNDLVIIFEKIKSYVFVSLHFKNKNL